MPALAAVAAALCAGPAAAECKLQLAAQFPVTMHDLIPVVPATINGADARLVTDSGGFFNMLTETAETKFNLKNTQRARTVGLIGVGGEAEAPVITAKDFTLAGRPFPNTDFIVGEVGGGLSVDGLIGENMMGGLDIEFDFANGMIRLFRQQGCEQAELAYWDKTRPYSVVDIPPTSGFGRRIEANASLNGVPIRALFDTGSPTSILTDTAAARTGVKAGGDDVHYAGITSGVTGGAIKTWIGPFKSFKLGDEEISAPRLRFGDIEIGVPTMLLGMDFFLSHRIYVANSQHKLYFTYNGGPIFRLDDESAPLQAPTAVGGRQAAPALDIPPPPDSDEPKDADGSNRRGAAFAARRGYVRAIADFTHAIALQPNEPFYFYGRAVAEARNGDSAAAKADLEQALKLKPDDPTTLMARGALRLAAKDDAGARADFLAAGKANPDGPLGAGERFAGQGLFQAAVDQYDLWIAAHPADPDLGTQLDRRCWSRALWGQELDKALADCNATLKLQRHIADRLNSRGLVYLRLGQFDAAVADYNEALGLNSQFAWARFGRGIARLRKGMKTEGEADMKAADVLDPNLRERAASLGIAP